MAADGKAFSRWLGEAKVSERKLTPGQIAVLQSAHCFRERCGSDYYSQRILTHYLLHCGTGLKVAQIARLAGVSRPTASEQQGQSSKQVVQTAHHRMEGRPHGKLLPRHAGSIAQFLVTHPNASRLDILDFIERAWQVRVSTVALFHFMKKYGLDKAQRCLAAESGEPPAVAVSSPEPSELPAVTLPPPGDFFLPTPSTRGRSSSSRRR
jgi:transposase